MDYDTDKLYDLTTREKNLLYWICKGKSLSETGRNIDRTKEYVTQYLRRICKKLDISLELSPPERRKILYDFFCPKLMEMADEHEKSEG